MRLRHRRKLLTVCAVSFLSLASCTEAIPLGSECPSYDGVCKQQSRDAGVTPSDAPLDADMEEPERPEPEDVDLQPVPDASGAPEDAAVEVDVDAGDPADGGRADAGATLAFPAILNPSFELTGGEAGDVTVLSANGTVIAPWYTCQPLGGGVVGPLSAVRAEREARITGRVDGGTREERVLPEDGATFVGMRYFGGLLQIPLVQKLREPLRAGTDYGVAIDVRVESATADLALSLSGMVGNCWTASDNVLTQTPAITQSGWQTLCLTFTPAVDLSHLVIAVASPEAAPNNSRLFIDNVRDMSECTTR